MKTVNLSESSSNTSRQLGFWAAALTAFLAACAFGLGITTPPRSGPFCAAACIPYPYTDVASFVPRDYVWMVPGILYGFTFVMLIACIHACAQDDRKVFSQVGLSFAVIAAALIVTDYFIQLSVLQPSLLKGETEGLSLFSQYNPHGIFIALEDLGYLMMSLAFLFVSFAFVKRTRLERAIAWLFAVSPAIAIVTLIGFVLLYGANLEYRFEVAVLTIDWITMIAGGVLLAVFFRRTA